MMGGEGLSLGNRRAATAMGLIPTFYFRAQKSRAHFFPRPTLQFFPADWPPFRDNEVTHG